MVLGWDCAGIARVLDVGYATGTGRIVAWCWTGIEPPLDWYQVGPGRALSWDCIGTALRLHRVSYSTGAAQALDWYSIGTRLALFEYFVVSAAARVFDVCRTGAGLERFGIGLVLGES